MKGEIDRRSLLAGVVSASVAATGAAARPAPRFTGNGFASQWSRYVDTTWTGPDLWAQRLQDWRIRDGRLECFCLGRDRVVHLLTHQIDGGDGDLSARWTLRLGRELAGPVTVGLRIGARGQADNYLSAVIDRIGFDVGMTGDGRLVLGKAMDGAGTLLPKDALAHPIEFRFQAKRADGGARLTIEAHVRGKRVARATTVVPADTLRGNIALLAHGPDDTASVGPTVVAFDHLTVEGTRLVHAPTQTFGPIYFAQHTVHAGVLKLTAQLAPIDTPDLTARLLLKRRGEWQQVATAPVHPLARTAAFRVADWQGGETVPYRVLCDVPRRGGGADTHDYTGSIPLEPAGRAVRVLTMCCNYDAGFPDAEVVANAQRHDADVVMFLGDQFYEWNGGFFVETAPVGRASLDYLRKWIQFGWSYRELFRNRPSLCLVDDHDVYHGNLWGSGGRAAPSTGSDTERSDSGGYKMSADWVNMAQATQTSHMPDYADRAPVAQGISVYFGEWNYAGIRFAIIEDRKFKTPPSDVLPPDADVYNGYARHPDYDRSKERELEAELIGERQMRFLRSWKAGGRDAGALNVLVSATAFHAMQTLPAGVTGDDITPKLTVPARGEYVMGDAPTRDMDSNGWPQRRRDEIVTFLADACDIHLAGDQHLASVVQYGARRFGDSCFVFTAPALCNLWPRRWWPTPGPKGNLGEFRDGFGNRMTVHAVANPVRTGLKPSEIYDFAPGYGLVELDPAGRTITLNCWARPAGMAASDARQFDGWPVRLAARERTWRVYPRAGAQENSGGGSG